MPAKKLSRQQRQRLADPETYAAMNAAAAEGRARFDSQMNAVFAEMKPLFAKRQAGNLSAAEAVRLIQLEAEFNSLSIQQKHFVEAALAERLGPRDGSELADA